MRKYITILFIVVLSLISLIGCEKNPTTSIAAKIDHSEMDHSEMNRPVPDTSEMEEVSQQQISNSISYWHNQDVKGTNIKVAVLDTGIDINNKELNYIKGINFVEEDKDNFNDDNGHGTKISGIICARENSYNLLGISPNCELYIAKVTDKNGNVKIENLVKGINWAVEQKVDVINISLEFPKGNKELLKVIEEAYNDNIIIISSSGNINYPGDTHVSYPGAYPEVISVGMLNTDGKIFSEEFSEKKVDVFAPGQDIFSTYFNNKMTLDTGVSFATAYTTGYTALLIQHYKDQNLSYDHKMILNDLKNYLESNM